MQETVIEKIKTCLGRPTDPEALAEARTDLVIVGVSHNFAEVFSVVLVILILLAEQTCYAIGFSPDGRLGSVLPDRYRKTGMTGGWRLNHDTFETIPMSQTIGALLIVLCGRILITLLEEKHGSKSFSPRRKHVKRVLDLFIHDGPFEFRMLCYAMVISQLFIVPSEMAYFGRWMYESACGEVSAECKT